MELDRTLARWRGLECVSETGRRLRAEIVAGLEAQERLMVEFVNAEAHPIRATFAALTEEARAAEVAAGDLAARLKILGDVLIEKAGDPEFTETAHVIGWQLLDIAEAHREPAGLRRLCIALNELTAKGGPGDADA